MDLFFDPEFNGNETRLNTEESHHCLHVLRNSIGDSILIGNGQGTIWECVIRDSSKSCLVEITKENSYSQPASRVAIAISPTKSSDRFEWFIEKATELGACEIIPTLFERSERRKINSQRLFKKAVSALKQSKNPFLPKIHDLQKLEGIPALSNQYEKRYIAHQTADKVQEQSSSYIVVVGPEGGLTTSELEYLETESFKRLNLGQHTLRTETAGIMALTLR